MTIKQKPFYKSKTKMGAALIALGPLLVTLGGLLQGSIDLPSGLMQLTTEVGIVLSVFGLRDLPFVNKAK